MERIGLLCLFLFSWNIQLFSQTEAIIPAGDWRDTDGKLIAATEGGFVKVGDLYYLWGMDRSANNYTFEGVNLYSSPDLKNWTFVNQILKKTSHPDINNGAVVERAKILHNESTGQFVMWMHFEGMNPYSIAEVAYATCNTIGGDYTFHSHFRPLGLDSRDLNVYKDTDGKAYLICTTQGNQSVSLFELDASYTGIVREVFRGSASNDMECEGHAIIKSGGYYFWMMSWCSGWDFNENHYYYATSLAGPWTNAGNIATSNTHTYESQVGFAVTVPGSETTTFLYKGDRWSVRNFGMSRIVLLPVTVSGTNLRVDWYDQWDIDTETGRWAPGARNFIDGVFTISAKHSGKVLGTNGTSVQQQTYTGADNQHWRIENMGASHFRITSVASGNVIDINGASREAGARALQYAWKDSYNQKWHIIDCGGGYHRLVNVNTLGKTLEISGSSQNDGVDAVIGDFRYSDHQQWQIKTVNPEVVSGNTYMIVNRTSGKALDIAEGNEETSLIQSTASGSANQIWMLQDLLNGYYTITNISNGKSIDNLNSTSNLTEIKQRTESGKYAQQWQVVPLHNGFYKLVNRMSGKVMDNKDGLLTDGNIMIQYTDYASTNNNQQWQFVPSKVVTSVSQKLLSEQVKCYPNPAHDKVTIMLGAVRVNKVQMTDIHGKEVLVKSGHFAGHFELDTKNLPGGMYFISLVGDGLRMVKVVVVE